MYRSNLGTLKVLWVYTLVYVIVNRFAKNGDKVSLHNFKIFRGMPF